MKKTLLLLLFFALGAGSAVLFMQQQAQLQTAQNQLLTLPETTRLLPVPLEESHILKADNGSMAALVWFGNYGDVLSHALFRELEKLTSTTTIPLTISFRHAAMEDDTRALEWAIGAEAAALQGKFTEFHQAVFSTDYDKLTTPQQVAEKLGLDMGRFQEDLSNPLLPARVYRDGALARSLGLESFPTLLVNGQPLPLPITLENLQLALEVAREEAERLLSDGVPADQLYETMLLRMDQQVNLSEISNHQSRHMVIPRHDFPVFGSREPLIWIYYFGAFGGPFAQEGAARLASLQQKYGQQLQVIFLPLAQEQNAASQLAAACSYWAADHNRFAEVFSRLNSLPLNYSASDVFELTSEDGRPLCPDSQELESYQDLVAAAGQLKTAMGIKSDPALLINGIEIAVIREERFFNSLIAQEIALATSLQANGLHGPDLLLAITRTVPSTY